MSTQYFSFNKENCHFKVSEQVRCWLMIICRLNCRVYGHTSSRSIIMRKSNIWTGNNFILELWETNWLYKPKARWRERSEPRRFAQVTFFTTLQVKTRLLCLFPIENERGLYGLYYSLGSLLRPTTRQTRDRRSFPSASSRCFIREEAALAKAKQR